eukprot:c54855_g1_i1 orf=2-181(-)
MERPLGPTSNTNKMDVNGERTPQMGREITIVYNLTKFPPLQRVHEWVEVPQVSKMIETCN